MPKAKHAQDRQGLRAQIGSAPPSRQAPHRHDCIPAKSNRKTAIPYDAVL